VKITWKRTIAAAAVILLGLAVPHFSSVTAHEADRISSVAKLFVEISPCPKCTPSQGHGTATYIGNNRWLTAKHLTKHKITSLRTPTVGFYAVEVEWECKFCDIAVVRTKPQKVVEIPAVPYSCTLPPLGEPVSYTGNPTNSLGIPFLTFYGRVSGVGHILKRDGEEMILVSIWANFGTSGAALLDSRGTIVGVMSAQDRFGSPFGSSPQPVAWASVMKPFCQYEASRTED